MKLILTVALLCLSSLSFANELSLTIVGPTGKKLGVLTCSGRYGQTTIFSVSNSIESKDVESVTIKENAIEINLAGSQISVTRGNHCEFKS